jgi:hypothetical protein
VVSVGVRQSVLYFGKVSQINALVALYVTHANQSIDVVDPLFELPTPPEKIPRGVKGAGRELAKTAPVFKGSKVETKLGIRYRSLTTCSVDMYNSVLEYADKIWK